MRHITQIGLDLINRFEGFSPTIYICPVAYPTEGADTWFGGRNESDFATEWRKSGPVNC